MNKTVKRATAASCLLAMAMNLTACGYFLYPERKGQEGGRVDPVVVILDGAALLFGILPGVVAFAVDFTNGTIYLPSGGSSAIDRHISAADGEQVREVVDEQGQAWLAVPLQGEGSDQARLDAALEALAGEAVSPRDVVWVDSVADVRGAMTTRFAAR